MKTTEPNKAPEPMPMLVTPRAFAPAAPSSRMAHLRRSANKIMKTKFKKTPVCEVCEKEEASSFSCMSIKDGKMTDWKFCGACTSEKESYYIRIDDFFDSPSSTVDWMAHMSEKSGMEWSSFMEMMDRFREATDSYNSL